MEYEQWLQVLIGTGSIAASNAANATGLSNGQFLIWGDNGLERTPNVAIAGIAGISHRFASIWKVQNSGAIGTLRVAWVKNLSNLSLIQSADNVFNSSDAVTPMAANEITVNGIVYNYADVTLSNGQYFTFAAKVAAPGGVSGPVVWLKADQGTTLAGSSVSGWVNYGNSGGIAGQLGRTSTLNWALPNMAQMNITLTQPLSTTCPVQTMEVYYWRTFFLRPGKGHYPLLCCTAGIMCQIARTT